MPTARGPGLRESLDRFDQPSSSMRLKHTSQAEVNEVSKIYAECRSTCWRSRARRGNFEPGPAKRIVTTWRDGGRKVGPSSPAVSRGEGIPEETASRRAKLLRQPTYERFRPPGWKPTRSGSGSSPGASRGSLRRLQKRANRNPRAAKLYAAYLSLSQSCQSPSAAALARAGHQPPSAIPGLWNEGDSFRARGVEKRSEAGAGDEETAALAKRLVNAPKNGVGK